MSNTITLKQSLIAIVAFIVIYTIFFQYFDLPIDTWANQTLPNTAYYSISALFAKLFGIKTWALIAVIFLVLGYRKRHSPVGQNYLLFSGSIILTIILTDILKFTLARYRPIEWFTHQLYGFDYFSRQYELNSTPSGHTAGAFATLFAIAHIRKKWALTLVLLTLATLIGLSRIVVVAHYPSDVIFGAYVGILSVYWWEALFNNLIQKRITV